MKIKIIAKYCANFILCQMTLILLQLSSAGVHWYRGQYSQSACAKKTSKVCQKIVFLVSTTWRSLWPKGGLGSLASTTATRLKMTHHENRKQRAIITLTSSLLRRIRQPINRHLPLESVTWPCARIASSSGRVSGNKSGYLTCDYILESKSCQKHFQSHVSIWCVL